MRLEQALASSRIEGHLPSAEFLADMQAIASRVRSELHV
ncbi:hypothetical protein ACS5PK_22560 [Roseateles sp. DB2]